MAQDPETYDENRISFVEYDYRKEDGFGRLSETTVRVWVNKLERGAKDRHPALWISNKNALPCLLADPNAGLAVYQRYDFSLTKRVQELRDVGCLPAMPFKADNGEEKELIYWYIPPEYRFMIRGMLNYIVNIHKENQSLIGFTADNLFLKNGEVVFFGVDYCDATPYNRKRDFNTLYDLFRQIFPELFGVNSPQLLGDLMDKLFTYNNNNNNEPIESLLANHLSLLPPKDTLSFIRNLSDMQSVMKVNSRIMTGYTNSIDQMVLENIYHGWNQRLRDVATCFNTVIRFFQQSDPISHNRYLGVGDSGVLISLFRCGRNMVEHIMELLAELGGVFGDLEIEIMIISVFGKELVKMQRKLYDNSCLSDFMDCM